MAKFNLLAYLVEHASALPPETRVLGKVTVRDILWLVSDLRAHREKLAALKAEHKDAMEVLATVAQVNSYYPGETFPRAITTANRFMATVDEVRKLKRRVDLLQGG